MCLFSLIGVAKGGKRRHGHPKFLENIVILYVERRFSKQNGVIRLKSNILPPPNFCAGYATVFTLKISANKISIIRKDHNILIYLFIFIMKNIKTFK